jgi:hypothetical protein
VYGAFYQNIHEGLHEQEKEYYNATRCKNDQYTLKDCMSKKKSIIMRQGAKMINIY